MMLYGSFEAGLSNMCRLIDRQKLLADPLPGQLHMKEVKTYLSPHISSRAWGREWEWMDELRVIRNAFAHSGGKAERQIDKATNKPKIGSRWETIKRFMRRNPKIVSLTQYNEIVIEDALIDRAIKMGTDALAKFHTAVFRLYR